MLNFLAQRCLAGVSDRLYSSLQYAKNQLRWPNLKDPQTFNEQIQWVKLHHHDPLLRQCADKVAVRDYVRGLGLKEILAMELGVYDKAENIHFGELPERFVLKCAHGSGMNIICRDQSLLDIPKARTTLARWLSVDFYKVGREWAYRDLPRRILCEEFLSGPDGEPPWDYKFHCFAGEPRYVQVDYARFVNHTRAIYDMQWQRLECGLEYARETKDSPRPATFDHMVKLCRLLSAPFPYVRVDLFEVGSTNYFGELTFYPGKGVERFTPLSFDREFGKWLRLSGGKLAPVDPCPAFSEP